MDSPSSVTIEQVFDAIDKDTWSPAITAALKNSSILESRKNVSWERKILTYILFTQQLV